VWPLIQTLGCAASRSVVPMHWLVEKRKLRTNNVHAFKCYRGGLWDVELPCARRVRYAAAMPTIAKGRYLQDGSPFYLTRAG
jgi:hypothetical protein